MKRRSFLLGTAGLATAAVLTACGGATEPGGGGSGTGAPTSGGAPGGLDPNTEAELTLFHWSKDQAVTVDDNIKSFTAKYPKIKVNVSIAAYKDYWTKLRTQAEGEQLPDVFWMNGPNIQLYASNDMLAQLEDDAADWSKYPPALVELYTVGGKHYGIPKDYDTIACFVNTKVFEESGVAVPTGDWTWDDHHKAAKAISDQGKYHGALIGVGSGQETFYNTIPQAGGFVIKDGKSGYDDPKSIAGIQYLRDLIADGSVPSLQVMTDTSPGDLFKSGKGGILWDGSWSAKPVNEAFPDPGHIVVVPLPKGEKQATVIHGLAYVANAKSPNLAAAKALVQHMTSKEANDTEAKNGTAIPAFTGSAEPWVQQAPKMNLEVFVKGAEDYSVPYPVSKNTSAWASLEPDFLNPAFSGDMPVEEACKKLAAKMNELLAAE